MEELTAAAAVPADDAGTASSSMDDDMTGDVGGLETRDSREAPREGSVRATGTGLDFCLTRSSLGFSLRDAFLVGAPFEEEEEEEGTLMTVIKVLGPSAPSSV